MGAHKVEAMDCRILELGRHSLRLQRRTERITGHARVDKEREQVKPVPADLGVALVYDLLCFNPYENEEHMRDTLELILRLPAPVEASVSVAVPVLLAEAAVFSPTFSELASVPWAARFAIEPEAVKPVLAVMALTFRPSVY